MDSERPVPASLRHLVQSISVTTGANSDPVTVVPDTATGLVFCEHGSAGAFGPRTRAGYYEPDERGPARRVVVRLQPGRARLLLDRPARELVDRIVPVPWAHLDLTSDEVTRVLLTRVADRPRREVTRSDLAHRAAAILAGNATVSATARQLNLSERQLRAIFTDTVGVSPKQFTRIDRLRAVLAGTGQGSWSDLAIATGFYDQAHLTVEFRRIMGVPPAAFASGQRTTAIPCHAHGTNTTSG